MEFRLLYEGEILPSGNRNTRPSEKHAIRRKLHPQLRRLWKLAPQLQQYATSMGADVPPETDRTLPPGQPPWTDPERINAGIEVIGKQWNRFGYSFVPLVTSKLAVRCRLDILLLRPEEDRFIFRQGDIDGQIKTIFDALAIPANLGQVGSMEPQEDETPFFCLLEDDRLISEVHVNADQLLMLPLEREVRANDTFVLIHVKVNHIVGGALGNWLD